TIQIDMLLAKKFGMEYVDSDGEKKTPYIIHRTSIGCYQRTLALLLEKYAGALPTWMAPTQVRVLPISERTMEKSTEIYQQLRAAGLRVELDERSEKIGYKIREAQMQKIPYMVIIGEKEAEAGTVSVRSRHDGDLGSMPVDDFLNLIKEVIDTKAKK
ncbi:MAG: threonine--tRNA ligase, partial [Clostridia bacterium]|nr:threonine--tRNA ligase [Clostridia bacterium]